MPAPQIDLTTRQRILAYLAEHARASARSLSKAWRLTPADIRYHLNILHREGIVERVPLSIGGAAHPGRPEQFYRLSQNAAPNNLAVLCIALLAALLDQRGETSPEQMLRSAASAIAATFSSIPETAAASSAARRLSQAVEQLNANGYRSRWEAGPSGPRIILRACPYAQLVKEHPEICVIDRFILEKMTGLSLQQTERINPITSIPPACIFSSAWDNQTLPPSLPPFIEA